MPRRLDPMVVLNVPGDDRGVDQKKRMQQMKLMSPRFASRHIMPGRMADISLLIEEDLIAETHKKATAEVADT